MTRPRLPSIVSKIKSLFYILKRQVGAILFIRNGNSISAIDHFGGTLYVFDNQRIGGKLKWNTFESQEMSFLNSMIQPDDVCLDIGANIGAYTTMFAVKAKQVIAIEPIARNVKLIELTAEINQQKNIKIIHCLVSDKDSENLDFLMSEETGLSGIYAGAKHKEYLNEAYGERNIEICQAQCIKIDSLQLKELDIVKIDVEGAEMMVLRGSLNTIRYLSPRLIMIEIVDSAMKLYGHSLSDILKLMEKEGYVAHILQEGILSEYKGEIVSNDNFFFKKQDDAVSFNPITNKV